MPDSVSADSASRPVPILIVASHGRLGQAALDCACQIFGPIEPSGAVGLDANGRLEDLEAAIRELRRKHGAERPTVLLVDLFGGSCANVAAKILRNMRVSDTSVSGASISGAVATDASATGTRVMDGPMRVIAGFNLAMLVEFAFSKDKYDLDALADRMMEAGRKSCLDVNAKLRGVGAR